jgi:hypothetical protein
LNQYWKARILARLLGIIGSAFAAGIVGSGTLDGWTVIIDGEVACADSIEPFINKSLSEIASGHVKAAILIVHPKTDTIWICFLSA